MSTCSHKGMHQRLHVAPIHSLQILLHSTTWIEPSERGILQTVPPVLTVARRQLLRCDAAEGDQAKERIRATSLKGLLSFGEFCGSLSSAMLQCKLSCGRSPTSHEPAQPH